MKAFALVVIGLALFVLPSRSVADSTSNFRVAYLSQSHGYPVCIMDAMTLANACPYEPEEGSDGRSLAWSPDGTMIAVQQELFDNGENVGARILVLAADGSDHLANGRPSPAVVTGLARVEGRPMWSADSRRVAGIGEGSIVIANIAGGPLDVLELGEVGIFDAAWSPDSTQFTVGRADADGNAVLVLVDARTGAQRTLLDFAGNEIGAGFFNGISWSPDGQRILFTYSPPPLAPGPGGASQHWIVDADGSKARMLYNSPVQNGLMLEARFSSDGQFIAFDGYSGAIRNVFVMKADGSDVHQLTHSATGAFGPRFDGEGRVLYFDLDTASEINMITFDSDDPEHGAVKALLPGIEFEWAPAPGRLPAVADSS
jgi:Tol biopolymer transport system component